MVAFIETPSPDTIRLPVGGAERTGGGGGGGGGAAERRMFPRRASSGTARGKRLDHSPAALRRPALTLALRDVSVGGLSAISDTPLQRGERLAVRFPAQGVFPAGGAARAAWDAAGRVIRCETSGLGYRLAIEFDAVPTAA
jgi:hypothetical protein